jgi:hypothetical protein
LFAHRSPFSHYTSHLLGASEGAVIGLVFDKRDPSRSSAKRTLPFFDEVERGRILNWN